VKKALEALDRTKHQAITFSYHDEQRDGSRGSTGVALLALGDYCRPHMGLLAEGMVNEKAHGTAHSNNQSFVSFGVDRRHVHDVDM
jgi:hypothetical protein